MSSFVVICSDSKTLVLKRTVGKMLLLFRVQNELQLEYSFFFLFWGLGTSGPNIMIKYIFYFI